MATAELERYRALDKERQKREAREERLLLQLEQLQTALERSLSTASYSSYGGEEEAAGKERCRESSQPSASVSGFVTSTPVGTMPLAASRAIFSWLSGSIAGGGTVVGAGQVSSVEGVSGWVPLGLCGSGVTGSALQGLTSGREGASTVFVPGDMGGVASMIDNTNVVGSMGGATMPINMGGVAGIIGASAAVSVNSCSCMGRCHIT